jgi:hypothetical protein
MITPKRPCTVMANPQLDATRDEVVTLWRIRFEELGSANINIFTGDIQNLGTNPDRFDIISVAYDWTEEEKCQRLPLYLRDHVLDVYHTIPQDKRAVFNDMLTDSRIGISTTDAPKIFGCQLRAHKQRQDNPSAMFASIPKRLARQAHAALAEAQFDLLQRDCFIVGLQGNIQNRLLDMDVSTFVPAIKLATNLEIHLRYFQPTDCYTATTTMDRPSTSITNTELLQLNDEVEDLKKSKLSFHTQRMPPRTHLNHATKPHCPDDKRYRHTESVSFYRSREEMDNNQIRPRRTRQQRGMENHKEQQQVRFQNVKNLRIPRQSKSPDTRDQIFQRNSSHENYLRKQTNSNLKQSYATQSVNNLPMKQPSLKNEATPSLYVTELNELRIQLRRLKFAEWSNATMTSDSRIQKETKPQENNITSPNTAVVMRAPKKIETKNVQHTTTKNQLVIEERIQKKKKEKSKKTTFLLCMYFYLCYIVNISVTTIPDFDYSQPAISDQISQVHIESCLHDTPTQLRPFRLLYEKETNQPEDTILSEPPIRCMDEATHVEVLPQLLNKARKIEKQNIEDVQEQHTRRYVRTAMLHRFHVEEQLLIQRPQTKKALSPMLQKKWEKSAIALNSTPQNVSVSPTCMNRQTPQWIHVNRYKPAPTCFEMSTPNKKISEGATNELPADEIKEEETELTQKTEIEEIDRLEEASQGNYTCHHKVRRHIVESTNSTVLLIDGPNECFCQHDCISNDHIEITLNCEIETSGLNKWPSFKLNTQPLSSERPNEFLTLVRDKSITVDINSLYTGLSTILKRLTKVASKLSHLCWLNVSFQSLKFGQTYLFTKWKTKNILKFQMNN